LVIEYPHSTLAIDIHGNMHVGGAP